MTNRMPSVAGTNTGLLRLWQQAKKKCSPKGAHKSPQQEGDMHVRAPGTSETKEAWSTAIAPCHLLIIFEVFRRGWTIDRSMSIEQRSGFCCAYACVCTRCRGRLVDRFSTRSEPAVHYKKLHQSPMSTDPVAAAHAHGCTLGQP